ncbi:MAG: UdgX family uracil-DNA binding protein [Carbonactinosporaceae bacterium]
MPPTAQPGGRPDRRPAGEPGAQRFVPAGAGLDGLREAARSCQGCELHEGATQTVFGVGSPAARVVFVGEQPGDQEDRQGLPFVGPAGRLLDQALDDAGIDRSDAYVTNAVKHFRFRQSGHGKRRMHQTPDAAHVSACRPWLTAELAILDPEIVVALGATAGRALLGPAFRVSRQRGVLVPRTGPDDQDASRQLGFYLATIHPSAVLRADDRDGPYSGLVDDLRVVAETLT